MVVCVVTPPNFTRNSGNCSGDFGPQALDVGSYSGRDYNSLRHTWNANRPQYMLGNIETAWANETLWSGDQIISPNGQYSAVMQWDGNFVIYNGGGTPVWSTGTYSPGARAVMQGDGNFVLYTPNNQPIWATSWRTGSCCVGGSRLVMQDDGNIVLYTPWNAAVWHRY